MVRASGKNRQLPSGRVSGVRLAEGACLGGHAAVLEQGMGKGQKAAEAVWYSAGDPLPHAARSRPGDACRAREQLAPRLDCRRRRNGAEFGISPGFAESWRT